VVVVFVLVASGCSVTFMQPSTEERPPQCYDEYGAPVADVAIAAIGTALVVVDSISARGTGQLTTYGLATAIAFSLSAMYGFDKRARCEVALRRWDDYCRSLGSGERPKGCDE